MTDIVERLRRSWHEPSTATLCDEAADEIERLNGVVWEENHINDSLRREIERLRSLPRIDKHAHDLLQEECERLRSDLELRNQTACDRKEIIAKLEAEIEWLRRLVDGLERARKERSAPPPSGFDIAAPWQSRPANDANE